MSNSTTSALPSGIYELPSAQEADRARDWIQVNLADTSKFLIEFDEAIFKVAPLCGATRQA